jgi:putative aminopeptidase FrvX
MESVAILKEMTMIPALSGHEQKMARYLSKIFCPLVDEIFIDKAGNLIAKINGSDPHAPKIMIFAHMDQLGFLVRKVEADGFIRLERLGGIPEKVLPGTRVWVEAEDETVYPGVIGNKAHHATLPEEKYVVTPYSKLYVDIGARSNQELYDLGIDVGSPVVYQPHFENLLESRIAATSIDDRGGCAILIKLAELAAKKRPAATLYLVGSVLEEFNLRGACQAAAAIMPDFAISLDLMISGDTPDLNERSDLKLGGGPIMGLYSFHGRGTLNGTIPHPGLVRLVKEAADFQQLTLQRSAAVGILTDSAYVQLVGTGIPSIDLGFAARYTHTPVEICDLNDLEGLLTLVWAMLNRIGPGYELKRG